MSSNNVSDDAARLSGIFRADNSGKGRSGGEPVPNGPHDNGRTKAKDGSVGKTVRIVRSKMKKEKNERIVIKARLSQTEELQSGKPPPFGASLKQEV